MRHTSALLFASLVVACATPASAQIPDTFENLKVLPKDISRSDLITVMRGFAGGLGVRCTYCHQERSPGGGADGLDIDFKSDKKPTKEKARFMMRMVRTVNDSILPKLPEPHSNPHVQVRCATCHRGSPLPKMLDAVLVETIDKHGIDSAVVLYRALREENTVRGRYSFTEGAVWDAVRTLSATNRTAESIRLLALNVEFFPNSAQNYFQTAELYRAAGNREKAIEWYRMTLQKAPNHEQSKQRLRELGMVLGIPGIDTRDATARPFAKGVISNGDASCPAFMPDGRSLFFMREAANQPFIIMYSEFADGRWSTPVVAPFSGKYSDIDPFVTPDGTSVIFSSLRPLSKGAPAQRNYQLWAVKRNGGAWSEPFAFGPVAEDSISRFFATATKSGAIYFAQRTDGTSSGNDIYTAVPRDGSYHTVRPVTELNTQFSDSNPYVAPDGSYIVFFSARPGGAGNSDLYVSFRNNDSWTAPRNLGREVNTEHSENCPALSPDGKYLFFARGRRDAQGNVISRDMFYISSDVLKRD